MNRVGRGQRRRPKIAAERPTKPVAPETTYRPAELADEEDFAAVDAVDFDVVVIMPDEEDVVDEPDEPPETELAGLPMGAVAVPAISDWTEALNVPVMPAIVNFAENANSGNVGLVGS